MLARVKIYAAVGGKQVGKRTRASRLACVSGWHPSAETNVCHPRAGNANARCAFCRDGGTIGSRRSIQEGCFCSVGASQRSSGIAHRRSIGIRTHEAGTLTRDRPEAGPESKPEPVLSGFMGRLKAISKVGGGHGVMGSGGDHFCLKQE